MTKEKITKLRTLITEKYSNTAGLIVQKNGETLYEAYFNGCTASSTLHVYSVSKSIISLLIGIAIDQGVIQHENQNILDFFPEYSIQKRNETLQQTTLHHLLTMTVPYNIRVAPYAYTRYFMSDDWLRFALNRLGGKGQLGAFNYAPLIGPDILSGILIKATGHSVLSFARQQLFSPLGIAVADTTPFKNAREQQAFNKSTTTSGWAVDPQGLHAAGWGLSLTAADLAKIGQLCLADGRWQEQQLVPAQWLQRSRQEHSRWQKQQLAYGFLWWVIDEKDGCYAAMGDGGNILYINTKQQLVVASTALFTSKAADRIALIREHIEPAFSN